MSRWAPWSSKSVAGGSSPAAVGSTPMPSRLRPVASGPAHNSVEADQRKRSENNKCESMEIPLFENDKPLQFERIVLYPYPDLKRIWVRCWLPAVQETRPNLEIRILNPDGAEDNSTYSMELDTQKFETTMHMRHPIPGATYHVVAELSLGLNDNPELLDRQEFDLVLEFRDAERHEPGFGVGIDWDNIRDAGNA